VTKYNMNTATKPDNTVKRTWVITKDEMEPQQINSKVYVYNTN